MNELVPVDKKIINSLKKTISEEIFSPIDEKYIVEPRGKFRNSACFVAKPRNTSEVSKIIENANLMGFGVIPYSGGSGLVCGQLATSGKPLLLSLEKLNKFIAFEPYSGIIKVEAGMILSDLKKYSQKNGRQFPLTLASQGSCMIGGNLATNAGGVNVLKYGNARDLCHGLEVVLADGRIYSDLKELKKDNTGYSIKDLLIGSEGTLGVITAASLRTFPLTTNTAALVSINSPEEAVELYSFLSNKLEFSLQAFELISIMGIDFLIKTGLIKGIPIGSKTSWLVLIEVGGGEKSIAEDAFESFLYQASDMGLVGEIIISKNYRQYAKLWEIRELIPEANRLTGSISNHDISIPLGTLSEFIEIADMEIKKILGSLRVNCFGHIGDGNLHYNIFPPAGESKELYTKYNDEIRSKVNELVFNYKGSVSAEHGIGRLKRVDLYRYSDPIKIELMKSIKETFDPNNILNPGSIFID